MNAVYALGASLAVCDILGLDEESVLGGLTNLTDSDLRGRIINFGDFSLLEDTYNSSPESVIADFELMKLYGYKVRSCILADMLELGEKSNELHEKIGKAVVAYGFKRLFTFGKEALQIANGAIRAGMDERLVFINTDTTDPYSIARSVINAHEDNELILCKGSHASGADEICKAIRELMQKR